MITERTVILGVTQGKGGQDERPQANLDAGTVTLPFSTEGAGTAIPTVCTKSSCRLHQPPKHSRGGFLNIT